MTGGRIVRRRNWCPVGLQQGLTLIEMLVAVVLSMIILGVTTAVTQMVVRQYRQLSSLEETQQQRLEFRHRLIKETQEIVTMQTASPQEWVFTSVWREPGESWAPRKTRLTCEKDESSRNWYLVLAHHVLDSKATASDPAAGNASIAMQEWGRIGPWSRCEFQVGSLRASRPANEGQTEMLIWDNPLVQASASRAIRYRILLSDQQDNLVPWVLHVW